MEIVYGVRNFFQSLTVLGWFIFVVALVVFLITAAIYLIKRGGERDAWFLVGIVALFLGAGLRYGIPFATELLSYGIGDSLIWVPNIQDSIGTAVDLAVEPWQKDGAPLAPTLTVTTGDVTIVATGGIPPTPVIATPTSTPEAPTSTPNGVGSGEPPPTLTNEQAATAIVIQQLTATYTPLPSIEPTLDMSNWNPQTPAPTRRPGG